MRRGNQSKIGKEKKNLIYVQCVSLVDESVHWADTCYSIFTPSVHRSHLNKGFTHSFEM